MKPMTGRKLLLILMSIFLVLPQSAGKAWLGAPTSQPATWQNSAPAPVDPAAKNFRTGQREEEGELGDHPQQREEWFYGLRTAGNPEVPFTIGDAALLRAKAAQAVLDEKASRQSELAPGAFGGSWSPDGPDPIVQVGRSSDFPYLAMSGRIGALAISSSPPYTMYLGAAQGGVWVSSTLTTQWVPKTDQSPSLAIGAITDFPLA